MLGTPTNHWASLAVEAFGAIMLACTTGRAVALLNQFLPDTTRSTDATTSSGSQIRPMPPGPTAAALLVLAGGLLFAGRAHAQTPSPTPSDVAPPLSFCIGTSYTCVMPDLVLNTVSYDLQAKQWAGGIQSAAVGYALLFASDKPYASGLAVHARFDFSQATASYFAPTFSLVGLSHFEAGYTPVFMSGKIGHQITIGINSNAESVMSLFTGKNIAQRYAARLKAYWDEKIGASQ
jgi:hypothetical protein